MRNKHSMDRKMSLTSKPKLFLKLWVLYSYCNVCLQIKSIAFSNYPGLDLFETPLLFYSGPILSLMIVYWSWTDLNQKMVIMQLELLYVYKCIMCILEYVSWWYARSYLSSVGYFVGIIVEGTFAAVRGQKLISHHVVVNGIV